MKKNYKNTSANENYNSNRKSNYKAISLASLSTLALTMVLGDISNAHAMIGRTPSTNRVSPTPTRPFAPVPGKPLGPNVQNAINKLGASASRLPNRPVGNLGQGGRPASGKVTGLVGKFNQSGSPLTGGGKPSITPNKGGNTGAIGQAGNPSKSPSIQKPNTTTGGAQGSLTGKGQKPNTTTGGAQGSITGGDSTTGKLPQQKPAGGAQGSLTGNDSTTGKAPSRTGSTSSTTSTQTDDGGWETTLTLNYRENPTEFPLTSPAPQPNRGSFDNKTMKFGDSADPGSKLVLNGDGRPYVTSAGTGGTVVRAERDPGTGGTIFFSHDPGTGQRINLQKVLGEDGSISFKGTPGNTTVVNLDGTSITRPNARPTITGSGQQRPTGGGQSSGSLTQRPSGISGNDSGTGSVSGGHRPGAQSPSSGLSVNNSDSDTSSTGGGRGPGLTQRPSSGLSGNDSDSDTGSTGAGYRPGAQRPSGYDSDTSSIGGNGSMSGHLSQRPGRDDNNQSSNTTPPPVPPHGNPNPSNGIYDVPNAQPPKKLSSKNKLLIGAGAVAGLGTILGLSLGLTVGNNGNSSGNGTGGNGGGKPPSLVPVPKSPQFTTTTVSSAQGNNYIDEVSNSSNSN